MEIELVTAVPFEDVRPIRREVSSRIQMSCRIEEDFVEVPCKARVPRRVRDASTGLLCGGIAQASRWREDFVGVGRPGVVSIKAAPRVAEGSGPMARKPSADGDIDSVVIASRLRVVQRG